MCICMYVYVRMYVRIYVSMSRLKTLYLQDVRAGAYNREGECTVVELVVITKNKLRRSAVDKSFLIWYWCHMGRDPWRAGSGGTL